MSSRTYTLSLPYGEVPVTVGERGDGAPVLLLHGGAGPDSFAGFGDLFAGLFHTGGLVGRNDNRAMRSIRR